MRILDRLRKKQVDKTKAGNSELETNKLKLVEVNSADDIVRILKESGEPHEATLENEKIQKNLTFLTERASDGGMKVFLGDFGDGHWAILSDSKENIVSAHDKLSEISEFQSRIKPDSLWGMCTYIHELTCVLGTSDGNCLRRGSIGDTDETIYPNRGLHEIAYFDNNEKGHSIYFDMTAKPYVFSDFEGGAENAILEGVMVVDQLKATKGISSLYRSNWERDKFNPRETREEYIKRYGARFFQRRE